MTDTRTAVENLTDFVPLMQPQRVVLVTSRFRDGRINVAPFAWCTPVSQTPPMLALALVCTPRRQRSLINILREREFIVNLPGADLAERVIQASYYYPKGVNKLDCLGFKTAKAQVLDLPILLECRAHVECKLVQTVLTGDHATLIADVIAASYDPTLFDENLLLNLDRTRPLLQLRRYNLPDGQIHLFLDSVGCNSYSVAFPPGGIDEFGHPVADEED